ncbi:helix-turn-helix domain-containing protein [Halegenticoccus tardaugens]|uniref:helix-turn-helix domain-containing protein n=1 Tax=Halegenticoccus tardaugens TaxID=2071624 RepID=UPI0013E964DD|nr:helix-turn-helix domain-containing protein [Halegenticoccus tardaugens]
MVDLTDSADEGLTQARYDLLTTVLKEGYFEVSRETSQAELVQILGISGQAVSERMRRGVQALLVQWGRQHSRSQFLKTWKKEIWAVERRPKEFSAKSGRTATSPREQRL